MQEIVMQTFLGLLKLMSYYLISAASVFVLRLFVQIPKELFRKILHIICVMSVFVLLWTNSEWYIAEFVVLIFTLILYPVLTFAEQIPAFGNLLSERRTGEIKSSLIIVHIMFALLTLIFWGLLGENWKFVIIASVSAWGFGDAAAALIGKRFGRRKIEHKLTDGKKTWEGTFSMFIVSGTAICVSLLLFSGNTWYLSLILGLLAAPLCAFVELISQRGMDTITVPISTAFYIFALLMLMGNVVV